jgi:hypothetical protein
MDTIDQATANHLAAGANGAVTLGDATYLVAQPTKADFIALGKMLRKEWHAKNCRPLAAIADELEGLPPDLREFAIKAAVGIKAKASAPDSGALSALIAEPEGCAAWVWILTRKTSPGLTLEQLRTIITEQNVNDVCVELLAATDMKRVDPNSTGATGL